MQRKLLVGLSLILFISSTNAIAEPTKETIRIRVVQARELTLDGEEGVWMPKEMANKLLSDIELIPKLEMKIDDLELALDVNSKRMDNFKLGMEHEKRSKEVAIKALQLSEIKLEETNTKLHIWYRNPVIWLVVGIVVGVGVEAAIFSAVLH